MFKRNQTIIILLFFLAVYTQYSNLISNNINLSCYAYSHLDEAQIYNNQALSLAKQHKWFEALTYIQKALKLNPFDEKIISNIAAIHNNIGISYLHDLDYLKALEHLKKAAYFNPLDSDIRLNLITAYNLTNNYSQAQSEAIKLLHLKSHDLKLCFKIAKALSINEDADLAITILQNILDKQPNYSAAVMLLASLLIQNNNFQEAIFYLKQLLEKEPDNKHAKKIIEFIKSEASIYEEYESESNSNFIVYYPPTLSKEWIDEYLNILDEIYITGEKFLGIKPQKKVVIILYSNNLNKDLMPNWVSGMYYDYKIRLNIHSSSSSPSQLKLVTAHEYCHHLVNLLSNGNCPIWLNEGLAQIFEGITIDYALNAIHKYKKTNKQIKSIDELEKLYMISSPDKDLYHFLYAYSFVLTQSLIDEYGIDTLRKFLSLLIIPNSFEIAFKKVYNQTLHDFFTTKSLQIGILSES